MPALDQFRAARFVLAVVTSGMAVSVGWVCWLGESPIGSLAFFEWDWSASKTLLLQRLIAGVLALAVVALWLPSSRAGQVPGRLGALVVACVLVEKAAAQAVLGGAPFSDWTLFASAAAWSAPLGLIGLSFGWLGLGTWILRIGIATTFFVHGCEALARSPQFVDLILIADLRWADFAGGEALLDGARARTMLTWIGVLDLLVATASLVARSRAIWAYMAVWGFLTAASRMAAGGLGWWHLSCERLGNGGVPLALVLLGGAWMARAREADLSDGLDRGQS